MLVFVLSIDILAKIKLCGKDDTSTKIDKEYCEYGKTKFCSSLFFVVYNTKIFSGYHEGKSKGQFTLNIKLEVVDIIITSIIWIGK